jgi:hypothetical protein
MSLVGAERRLRNTLTVLEDSTLLASVGDDGPHGAGAAVLNSKTE